MADMQSRQQLQTPRAVNPDGDMVQAMMSARAKIFAQPGVDALRAWAQEAKDPSIKTQTPAKQLGILYGASLSWLQLRDLPQARALLPTLRSVAHQQPEAMRLINLLETELAFKEDDMRKAMKSLTAPPVQTGVTASRPEMIYLAQASARLQVSDPGTESAFQLAQSVSALQRWVLQNPQDAQVWQVLATALAAQGRALASLRAEGEAQLARMDVGAAVDRFRAAQDASRNASPAMADHIEASIVDSRLRYAQGLLREQLLERQER
jgi:predicted Zn-dependent protease